MNKLEWFFYCYPRYITFVTFGQEEEKEKKGTSYRRFQNHPFVNCRLAYIYREILINQGEAKIFKKILCFMRFWLIF